MVLFLKPKLSFKKFVYFQIKHYCFSLNLFVLFLKLTRSECLIKAFNEIAPISVFYRESSIFSLSLLSSINRKVFKEIAVHRTTEYNRLIILD